MSERILVGTRKGLLIYNHSQGDATWHLTQQHFLGEPVSMCLWDKRDNALYAALNLGHFGVKLHRSDDDGASWQELAVPVYPEKPDDPEDPNSWSLELIWSLEPGGADQPGLLWAGTIPGGLFVSHDRGDSWNLVESLWSLPERRRWLGGGYNQPGIHSIQLHPDNSQHISLGVSCGGVWHSKDMGKHWSCRATGMVADYMPPELKNDPVIQDPHRLVMCKSQPEKLWVQHHNGIFRSIDAGKSWTRITNAVPSHFGFATVVHPADGETAWFVPAVKDECRIPVDGRFVVSRTRDGGHSFEVLDKGLPKAAAYDLVYRHGLDIAPDGNNLAMGSTTGSLWTSHDQGDSWKTISTHLPPIYCVRLCP